MFVRLAKLARLELQLQAGEQFWLVLLLSTRKFMSAYLVKSAIKVFINLFGNFFSSNTKIEMLTDNIIQLPACYL
jgi:hypothetical protein